MLDYPFDFLFDRVDYSYNFNLTVSIVANIILAFCSVLSFVSFSQGRWRAREFSNTRRSRVSCAPCLLQRYTHLPPDIYRKRGTPFEWRDLAPPLECQYSWGPAAGEGHSPTLPQDDHSQSPGHLPTPGGVSFALCGSLGLKQNEKLSLQPREVGRILMYQFEEIFQHFLYICAIQFIDTDIIRVLRSDFLYFEISHLPTKLPAPNRWHPGTQLRHKT